MAEREDLGRKRRSRFEKALADFPFERVETTGDQALRRWEELRGAGRGVPVVLGGDDDIEVVIESAQLHDRDATALLDAAARVRHPDDLLRERAAEDAEWLGDDEEDEWPDVAPTMPELSVAFDVLSQKPLQRVHIALIPTADWTTIPAHLRWGGWNACPGPEYHVAALRSWRDRFGAELVGLSRDVMNLRVARRPEEPEDALALAREHYAYCGDIIDQGVGSLVNLAAALMESEWWYFWWD